MSNLTLILCVFMLVICVLILVRNEIAYNFHMMAIDLNFYAYRAGPSYEQIMFDLRKWTFKQFYPQLSGDDK